jgi:Domain of unknown function (DUF3427)
VLNLQIHGEYGRQAAYQAVGVRYTNRQQNLNIGLSPRNPDGGYPIFITLDKKDLDEAYDYDDELFADRFRWVTRRDRSEDHPDYVRQRDGSTRVSLFVRHSPRDKSVYLGELRYLTHRQFQDERDRHVQQEYVFDLKCPVPEPLVVRLTSGTRPASKSRPRTKAKRGAAGPLRTRRPANLDEYKKAFSYALGRLDRTVVPAHQQFQVRLKEFLRRHGIVAHGEHDYVDIRFSAESQDFIGEVKVTSYLTLDGAFRSAIGQLLFYGFMRFTNPPCLVMFLDRVPDEQRIALATRLGIAVVVEHAPGSFSLLNPSHSPVLADIFATATAS